MSNEPFENQDCVTCFMQFKVPTGFNAARRNDKRSFYCPNGHSMSYSGDTEATKLRHERDRAIQEKARLEDELRIAWGTSDFHAQEAEKAQRQTAAARGQVTRLKNRAAAGLCPCCNRSFENLSRHMKTKHAGFTVEVIQDDVGRTVQ